MIRFRSLPAVLAAVSLAAGVARAASEDRTVAVGATGKKVVAWLEDADEAGFSGAILAARGGRVVAAAGVGFADLAGERPVTPATLFEIASTTKQFTAAAVLVLVQQGKLSLDDPIAKHLPGVAEDCSAITVRHLLQHTSGIPGSNSAGGGDRLDLVLPTFLAGGPRRPPGTHFEYWNQGYALLSEIVARAAGEPYVDVCRERLFEPAKMRVTRFTGDDPPRGAEVAVGRSAHGPPRSALEHPYGSYGFQYRGMGGVVSNVWDLWRWDRALAKDRILKPRSKAELFRPGLEDYALGWFVRKRGGRTVQFHTGSVRGFLADIRRYPEEGACVIVLANRDDAPLGRIADGLETLLFGGDAPPLPARPAALDAALLDALPGHYAGEDGRGLFLRRAGSTVRFELHWVRPAGAVTRGTVGLPAGGDGKTLRFDDGHDVHDVRVERDPEGAIRALTWDGKRFERRE